MSLDPFPCAEPTAIDRRARYLVSRLDPVLSSAFSKLKRSARRQAAAVALGAAATFGCLTGMLVKSKDITQAVTWGGAAIAALRVAQTSADKRAAAQRVDLALRSVVNEVFEKRLEADQRVHLQDDCPKMEAALNDLGHSFSSLAPGDVAGLPSNVFVVEWKSLPEVYGVCNEIANQGCRVGGIHL